MARIPIVVFARAPIPGRCKTRLASSVGAEAAAALSSAFLIDTLTTLATIEELAPELHVADSADHPFFDELCARFELAAPIVQLEGDLGTRMQHALDRGAPTLLVGSDAPTIPASILRAAIAATRDADVVLTPVGDGGFVLIASAGRAPTCFLSSGDPAMRWSTAHALADTVRAARAAGLTVALTAPHYDVDTAADLALLATQLAHDPSAAPASAAVLRRRLGMPAF